MLSVLFRNIAIIVLIHHSISEGKDLLHLFRPKPDLPRELNDFLTDVQDHQGDFAFIRNAVRNQKKYEKSYQESHDLLAEDIDNQMTINPDYNRNFDEMDQSVAQIIGSNKQQRLPYADSANNVYSGFESPNKFKHFYPQERYSKFIHSPIRLRRELEDKYLNGRVHAISNGEYGNVQRPEPKLPGNQLRDNENRYHTGFLVGVEEDADEEDGEYQNLKSKREVEISIKSDGKLVKHIEETEDAPKSIVLNIKSSNPNDVKVASKDVESSPLLGSSSKAPKLETENNGANNQPTSGESIPSFISSNTNQNRNIGVPINAIPAGNSGYLDSKTIATASLLSKEDASKISNGRAISEQEKQPFILPEVAKTEDLKKFEQPYVKPLDRADGWSSDNLGHMAKSIDLAQGNINSNFETAKDKPSNPNLALGLNDDKKEEFEKVQGLLVDTSNGLDAKPKERYMKKKRRSFESSEKNSDFSMQRNHKPQSVHWEAGDEEIHLDPNQTYEVHEHSTKDILVIPITPTTECPKMSEAENEAEAIGEVIAQEIIEEEENTECGATTAEEEEFEIVRHHETSTACDDCAEKLEEEEIDIIRKHPHKGHHHHSEEAAGDHGLVKRSSRRKSRKRKAGLKKNRKHHRQSHRRLAGNRYADTDTVWNRNHLATLPKYQSKTIHHHPKKRVDRQLEEQSLSDYYDLNQYYERPDDSFDYVPSYQRRSLKSLEYEFDPHLIPDVGSDEQEATDQRKSNAFMKQGIKKVAGIRKKFKSDGDYSDEEDSMTASPQKRVPVKKTKNQFAFDPVATTEDNDDDYDYSDLTDMEDEDEDITYEEVQGNNLELDDAVDNSSENEHENDRLRENLQREFVPLLQQLEATTQGDDQGTALAQSYSSGEIDDMLLEARQVLASAHGHGTAQKKKMKRKKKQKQNAAEQIQPETNESVTANYFRKKRTRLQSTEHNSKIHNDKALSNNHPVAKRSNTNQSPNEPEQFQEKPLTAQEKQDIFLRYNPDFQRWPRFIQNDHQYQALMRQRALSNRRRNLRTVRNGNNFPISNEYFLDPRPEFVKRQEPSTIGSEEVASSEPATEASSEASSPAASETIAGDLTASSTPSSTAEAIPTLSSGAEEGAASATAAAIEQKSPSAANSLDFAAQASATLPESAQNILQTANSDIFENTTVPGLGGLGESNSSPGAPQTIESSTEFQFTTKAEDLTPNSQCENATQKHIESCDEESAKHSPVPVTSVLPLLPDAASEASLNMTKDQFLDLDEILVGVLPRHVVSEALANAHGSVRPGLRAGRFNMNMLLSGFNTSAETNLILTEMTNLMKKLKYRSTCQILPTNLKTYVKIITKNEMDDPMMKLKEMNEIDFDEHQSNYVFHNAQNDNIHEKAGVLKELLNKYDNLPANCKERAEPVKEYIETHLAMIEHMGDKSNTKGAAATGPPSTPSLEATTSSLKPKAKKEISMTKSESASDTLEGQVVEEGMENQKADANEVIEGLNQKTKREASNRRFDFREISTSTSPQFGKLVHAVRNIRNRRQVMKRIGEIYGRNQRSKSQAPKLAPSMNEEKGFESPPVINF